MTSNPYIAQHYGSSMALMSNGHEMEDIDAAVGFSRFPNAAHMTHTVFKPKRAPAASARSPPSAASNINHNHTNGDVSKADASDVFATLRQHRGVPIDRFPSRPLTPKGPTSLASLPPLLPADRSSAGSNDSWRERGAGLVRNWVKAAADSSSSSSASSSSLTTDAREQAATTTTTTIKGAVEAVASAPSRQPSLTTDKRRESEKPTDIIAEGEVCASPPRLPATATATVRAALQLPNPPISASTVDHTAPSVSISPMSPHLGSNAKTTPANETPMPTPEPEGTHASMDWMLQRSRAALEHVQRVLGEAPESGSGTRALAPPPPMSPKEVAAAKNRKAATQMALPNVSVNVADLTSPGEPSPTDSLDYVSPLSTNHNNDSRGFPSPGKLGGPAKTSAFSAARRSDVVAVPDETRYMVLCFVHDPAQMAAQRLRRRRPCGGQNSQQAHQLSTAHEVLPPASMSHAAPFTTPATAPARRIAEVSHRLAATAAAPCEKGEVEMGEQLQPPRSSSASSSVRAALAATQPRHTSPPPPSTSTPRKTTEATSPALHGDPALLRELADFLRAGNGSGFSSLSAALASPAAASPAPGQTPAAAAAAAARARSRSPRARAPRRRSHPQAVAPPPPTVLLGHAPTTSAPAAFDRSFTPSSQLARVHPHDVAATTASPHPHPVPAHRPSTLPSYAQPTISWLSKGSEASADDFPLPHTTSALSSPPNESRSV